MIDEKKLREKLASIVKKPAYKGLHTFAYEPLINDVIEAVKQCEEEKPEGTLLTEE